MNASGESHFSLSVPWSLKYPQKIYPSFLTSLYLCFVIWRKSSGAGHNSPHHWGKCDLPRRKSLSRSHLNRACFAQVWTLRRLSAGEGEDRAGGGRLGWLIAFRCAGFNYRFRGPPRPKVFPDTATHLGSPQASCLSADGGQGQGTAYRGCTCRLDLACGCNVEGVSIASRVLLCAKLNLDRIPNRIRQCGSLRSPCRWTGPRTVCFDLPHLVRFPGGRGIPSRCGRLTHAFESCF